MGFRWEWFEGSGGVSGCVEWGRVLRGVLGVGRSREERRERRHR